MKQWSSRFKDHSRGSLKCGLTTGSVIHVNARVYGKVKRVIQFLRIHDHRFV